MFKHPKLVSITAAKLDAEQQSKEELIPRHPTTSVPHLPIRHMLAAAHSQQTQVVQQKLQSRERSVRTRAKILYMPSAAATTAATHSPRISRCTSRNMQRNTQLIRCAEAPVLRLRPELSHLLDAVGPETWPLKTKHFTPGLLTNI
jgi:hypothetical protein